MHKVLLINCDGGALPDVRIPEGHQLVCCSDVRSALSLLMGGSSQRHENYSSTGKLRPELVLLTERFLEQPEGYDFLEILRKYYSLRGLKVFVLTETGSTLDEALYRRYALCGHLRQPYDLVEALARLERQEVSGHPASRRPYLLFTGLLTTGEARNVLPGLKTSVTKAFAVIKSSMAMKLACITSGAVLFTSVVTALPGETVREPVEEQRTVSSIPPISPVFPAEPDTGLPAIRPSREMQEPPKEQKRTVPARKKRPAPPSPSTTATTTTPAQGSEKVQRSYAIRVIPEH